MEKKNENENKIEFEKIRGLTEDEVRARIEKGQINKTDDDKTRSNWEIIRIMFVRYLIYLIC